MRAEEKVDAMRRGGLVRLGSEKDLLTIATGSGDRQSSCTACSSRPRSAETICDGAAAVMQQTVASMSSCSYARVQPEGAPGGQQSPAEAAAAHANAGEPIPRRPAHTTKNAMKRRMSEWRFGHPTRTSQLSLVRAFTICQRVTAFHEARAGTAKHASNGKPAQRSEHLRRYERRNVRGANPCEGIG